MKKKAIIVICILLMFFSTVFVVIVLSDRPVADTTLLYFDRVRLNALQYASLQDRSFGLNIPVITNSGNLSIEYVSSEGLNTDSLMVKVNDYTPEDFKSVKVKGCRLVILGLVFETSADKVLIDAITLSVNGEQKTFDMADPVVFELVDGEYDNRVNLPVAAITYPYRFNETDIERNGEHKEYAGGFPFSYLVSTEKSVTLTGFGFNAFLEPIYANVLVNGEEKGSPSSCFPLRVEKGDQISIECEFKYLNGIENTDFGNVYCNSVLSGYVDDEIEIRSTITQMTGYGINSREDAEQFLRGELKRMK